MTEQEIRKQVKKEYRERRTRKLKDFLDAAWKIALFTLVIFILYTPFCLHMINVEDNGIRFLNEAGIIATGICAIPFALQCVALVFLIFIYMPVSSIVSAIKEHQRIIEREVHYRLLEQEKRKK